MDWKHSSVPLLLNSGRIFCLLKAPVLFKTISKGVERCSRHNSNTQRGAVWHSKDWNGLGREITFSLYDPIILNDKSLHHPKWTSSGNDRTHATSTWKDGRKHWFIKLPGWTPSALSTIHSQGGELEVGDVSASWNQWVGASALIYTGLPGFPTSVQRPLGLRSIVSQKHIIRGRSITQTISQNGNSLVLDNLRRALSGLSFSIF